MRFGEYYIGIGKMAGENVLNYLYTFPTFKFLFERPDNGLIIVEEGMTIFNEKKEHLVPLDETTELKLKEQIDKYYDERMLQHTSKRDADANALVLKNEDIERLKLEIAHLESLNSESFTENRARAIRQLSKALRRGSRNAEFIEQTIEKKTQAMNRCEERRKASMIRMKAQIKEVARWNLVGND